MTDSTTSCRYLLLLTSIESLRALASHANRSLRIVCPSRQVNWVMDLSSLGLWKLWYVSMSSILNVSDEFLLLRIFVAWRTIMNSNTIRTHVNRNWRANVDSFISMISGQPRIPPPEQARIVANLLAHGARMIWMTEGQRTWKEWINCVWNPPPSKRPSA